MAGNWMRVTFCDASYRSRTWWLQVQVHINYKSKEKSQLSYSLIHNIESIGEAYRYLQLKSAMHWTQDGGNATSGSAVQTPTFHTGVLSLTPALGPNSRFLLMQTLRGSSDRSNHWASATLPEVRTEFLSPCLTWSKQTWLLPACEQWTSGEVLLFSLSLPLLPSFPLFLFSSHIPSHFPSHCLPSNKISKDMNSAEYTCLRKR